MVSLISNRLCLFKRATVDSLQSTLLDAICWTLYAGRCKKIPMSATGSSAGTVGPGEVRTPRLPRSVVWVASLRNVLFKYNLRGRATSAANSEEDAELDRLLSEQWERYAYDNDEEAPSTFAKKIAELKSFYEEKMQEIAAREAEYTQTAGGDDTLGQDDPRVVKREIKRTLEFSARRSFNSVRRHAKKEVLKTIRTLRDAYTDTSGTKRSLPSGATKAMNAWFQSHRSDPYPSDAEKQSFAGKYGITVDQVTTWFSNKRYRSHSNTS